MNKFCNHEWVKLTEKPYETGIDYSGFVMENSNVNVKNVEKWIQ